MKRIMLWAALLVVGLGISDARADLLSMVNGDRYHGSIQMVNDKEVHLKSEILGLVKIPRNKVAGIQFGNVLGASAPGAAFGMPRQQQADQLLEAPGGRPAFDPKAVEKVQQEFLGTATPEANAMFRDMLEGLSSGKTSVGDIRLQARDALKQLKDAQSELGDEDDAALLSMYGAILENFIRAGGPVTNAPATKKPANTKRDALKLDDE